MKSNILNNTYIKYRVKHDDEKTNFELSLKINLYWVRRKSLSISWITVDLKIFLKEINNTNLITYYSSYPIDTKKGENLEKEFQRHMKLNKIINEI
jgi:hypothetical protein